MDVTSLIIPLVSGAIGGNAAGAVSKDTNLERWATQLQARSVAASGDKSSIACSVWAERPRPPGWTSAPSFPVS
jgi:hypothetical protein